MSAENVSGVTPFLLFQSVLRVKVSRQCPWSIIVIFFSSIFRPIVKLSLCVPLSNLAFASNSQTDILCVPFLNLSFESHSQTYPLSPILKLISFASHSQTYSLSPILKCIILCVPFSNLSCASHSQTDLLPDRWNIHRDCFKTISLKWHTLIFKSDVHIQKFKRDNISIYIYI